MESFTGSYLKGGCLDKVIDKHRGFNLGSKDVGLSKRSEICFLGLSSSKLVHINLLSLQRKIIQPISSVPALHSSSETQTLPQSEETEAIDTNQSIPVHVRFQLQKECSFGHHFLIVGDDPVLGSWNPENAVPLDWSEGHVWTVELDIPSGKTISYKFILKGDAETILWQHGPDRILQTWETKNTITVSDDWNNAELMKIVEEEHVAEQFEESGVNQEIWIAENVVPPIVDLQGDVNEEKNESSNEILAAIAENISEAEIFGNNGMAFSDHEVLSSTDDQTILVSDEGVPVLVPSMTQILSSKAEDILLDDVQMDKVVAEGSLEFKTEQFNVPELSSTGELLADSSLPKDTPEMKHNVEQEIRENVDVEDRSNGRPLEENVSETGIQWGKRALHKFFANLGFFKVELES